MRVIGLPHTTGLRTLTGGILPEAIEEAGNGIEESKNYEHMRRYPGKTVVVLDTKGAHGGREYRVGIVAESDFRIGLRCVGEELRLNPAVARRCFESSPVFADQAQAEAEAHAQCAPLETAGIKILQFHEVWPGRPCRLVS